MADAHTQGLSVFQRFTAGAEGTLWYYAELAKVFERRKVGPAPELIRTVREMARLAEGAPR